MKEALTYDDVLIVPQHSSVESRDEVDLSTKITPNVEIDIPLVSAPMDSVTEIEMVEKMDNNGGVGILHRVGDWELNRDWIAQTDSTIGAAIGISGYSAQNAIEYDQAGVDFVCVDVAHGHLQKTIEFVQHVTEATECDVMVGNVATWEGAKDLIKAGADSIKIGIGPGSECITREKTGVGVPQFTAVNEITSKHEIWQNEKEVTFIADGGITKPGDAAKALLAGADAVMMGGEFGECKASPGENVWGMASEKGKEAQGVEGYVEGVESEVQEQRTVEEVFIEYEDGLRSSLSYVGGHTLPEARENVEFVRTTPSATIRNGGFRKSFNDGD